MIGNLSPEQQRRLAIVLAIVLLLVVGWRTLPLMLGWVDAKLGDAAQRRDTQSRSIDGYRVVDVRLDDLEAEAATYKPERNIFRFGERPRPKPVVVEKPRQVAPPPPPPPPPPPTGPVPPPLDLELVGIFGPESRRIAVLTDGQEIINALDDDVIRDQFIVDEIETELPRVRFRFVGFPDSETAVLSLVEDRR